MWFRISTGKGLGEAIAQSRRAAGLSQEELAQQIRVDRTTVVRFESGRLQTFERLMNAFAMLGYDLVAVPRGSRVTVDER